MYDLTMFNEQASLQPTPAVTVLRERLRKGQALNTEVADWLQVVPKSRIALRHPADGIYAQERRRVEELYAQGLIKLAKKQPPGDQSELG